MGETPSEPVAPEVSPPPQPTDRFVVPRQLLQVMRQLLPHNDRGGSLVDLIRQKIGPKQGESPQGVKPTYTLREGKMVAINPAKLQKEVKEGGGKVREEGNLTLFEKIFMARYTEGYRFEEGQPEGRFVFGKKGEGEWGGFFEKMRPFAFEKTVSLSEIRDLIFRGLFGEKMVSDLRFANGKSDKFARLSIASQEAAAKLAQLTPGEIVAPTLLAAGSEITYTALSYKPVGQAAVDAAAQASAQAREQLDRGFLNVSAQSQNLALRELNLEQKYGAGRATLMTETVPGVRKKGGLLGAIFGRKKRSGSGLGEEEGGMPLFVPWFLSPIKQRRLGQGGRVKWYVILTYFVVTTTFLLAVIFALKFFL